MVARRTPPAPVVDPGRLADDGATLAEVAQGHDAERLARALACAARFPATAAGSVPPVVYRPRGDGWTFIDATTGERLTPEQALALADAWTAEHRVRAWCWSLALAAQPPTGRHRRP